jgi:CrcB protein
MNPWVVLASAAGGTLGTIARYAVGVISLRLLGAGFPYGTLFINISGSFLIGVFAELFALRWNASQEMRAFLTVGICGGYTTFSTFSLDFSVLLGRGHLLLGLLYVFASVIVGVLALYGGLYVIRAIYT